jgi:hypothetical protein
MKGLIDEIKHCYVRDLFRWFIVGAIFFFFGMNASYVFGLFRSVNPLPFLSGEVSRDAYLENKLPEYPAIQFLNVFPNDDMKVLALFVGKRRYYFDKPVEMARQRFAVMVVEASAVENLTAQLSTYGFTHCLIGIQHFNSWALHHFTDKQRNLLYLWMKNECIPLFSRNGYIVFRMKTNAPVDPITIN